MAIVTLGGGVASASGSIGGTTFSRNRGGPYMRNRSIPTNPNTVQQAAVRAAVSQLTSLWNNTLTDTQREAWDTYAENVPLPNRLGEPRNVGGLAMYVRSNVPRLQAALTRVDAAPTTFNLGDFTAPVLVSLTAPATGSLTFTDTDDWVGEDGSAMLLYGSRGRNPSVNFFKGPYRASTTPVLGAVVPPTSPHVVAWPFDVVVDQKAFLRVRVTRVDGRLSSDFRTVTTVV